MMRKIRKQKLVRCGVLVSYDPMYSGNEGSWLDELLDKGEAYYDTWNIKDAYVGLPVFIYEKNKGVVACAQIVQPFTDNEMGFMGAVDKNKYPYEIVPPISLKKLRDEGIITRNPPFMFQYLTDEQCMKLEDWLE